MIVNPETKKPDTEDTAPVIQNDGNNARASWPISTDTLRVNISHMQAENKALIVDCFLWCIQHGITKSEFANQVEIAENTLYRIITGKYTNPGSGERLDLSPKFAKAMKLWLADQKALAMKRSEFVLTPTARKAMTAPRLAHESRKPVILSGPSQIGKTWALEHYTETHNHGRTVYIRFGAASGLGGMLSCIAERIGVSPNATKEKMIQRIIKAVTSEMLLIFDEVHLLMHTYRRESFFACIEVLREIHDRTQCGMVLCLTELGRDKMETEKTRELMQLFRRGIHRVRLPEAPQPSDLKLICEAHGLPWPHRKDYVVVNRIREEPYEVLRQLAKNDGLLAITERLRYGKKLAEKKRQDLTWDHFIQAHLTVVQNDTAVDEWE